MSVAKAVCRHIPTIPDSTDAVKAPLLTMTLTARVIKYLSKFDAV
jgi:hypothetical protein